MGEYELEVQALDGGMPRLSGTTRVHITVPINRPPTILPTSTHMVTRENMPVGTQVGTLVVTDEDSVELEFEIADKKGKYSVQFSYIYTVDLVTKIIRPICTRILLRQCNTKQ